MNKQYAYILTGLPYAGKTTLRKKLVDRLGFEYSSVDDQMGKHKFHVEEMSQDDWNLVYKKAYEDLKRKLKIGKTVIVDIGI